MLYTALQLPNSFSQIKLQYHSCLKDTTELVPAFFFFFFSFFGGKKLPVAVQKKLCSDQSTGAGISKSVLPLTYTSCGKCHSAYSLPNSKMNCSKYNSVQQSQN